MLNVFLQQVKLTLDQWSIGGDKTNEPGSLKEHLSELLTAYPALQLLTGDAIYAQRPLLELLQEHGCDYLFQVKANQPDMLDALETCFFQTSPVRPAHRSHRKKGLHQETRRLWVNLDDADYIRERLNVPGCQIAIRVDREVRSAEGTIAFPRKPVLRDQPGSRFGHGVASSRPTFAATGRWKTAFTSSRTAGGTKIVTTPSGPAWPRRSLR